MNQLKIVGWSDFDGPYPTRKYHAEELQQILQMIRKEIMENEYVFSGYEHQYSMTGVPVFSDGTCFRASMRCWGGIMAAIYQGADHQELTYMDFYMPLDEEDSNFPPLTKIDVEPAVLEEASSGCTRREDREMVDEAIAFGMTFMTQDKVLKKLYEKKRKQ